MGQSFTSILKSSTLQSKLPNPYVPTNGTKPNPYLAKNTQAPWQQTLEKMGPAPKLTGNEPVGSSKLITAKSKITTPTGGMTGLTAQQKSDNDAYLASKGLDAQGKAVAPIKQEQDKTSGTNTNTGSGTNTGSTGKTDTTYPGIVAGMVGQAYNPNSSATEAQNRLQGIAMGGNAGSGAQRGLSDIAQHGTENVNQANKQLLQFQKQNPYMIAAQSNPNVAADIASGRSSLLGQTFGREEQALATNVANQLAQQGQQISAGSAAGNLALANQGQQIGAAYNAGNLAQTGQGLTQSALSSAAGYAAPKSAGSGYVQIDPQTGQPIGGTGGANAAAFSGGQTEASQAKGGQYEQAQGAINGAQNQLASLSQLIQRGNLNPAGVNLANEGIQTIQKNLSNSDYSTLLNTLQTIGQALGVDLVKSNNQQGGSLINTINNAINAARAQAEGLKSPQGGSSGGVSGVKFDSNGNPVAMSF